MGLTFNRKLDRCIDLRGGIAGGGMHNFILDEIEFGCRVAHQMDDPDQTFWVLHPLLDIHMLRIRKRGSRRPNA